MGMLIRPKRIHNFCLFHAYIAPLLHVLLQLLYHFESFFWTNLLTRCPVPVPVFCMFLVSEKLHRKSPRKKSEKFQKLFCDGRSQEPEAQLRRPNRGELRPPGVAHGPPAPGGGVQPSEVPRHRPFALFILSSQKRRKCDPFPETRPEAPPPPKTLKRGFCRPAPAPCRRGRSSSEASSSPYLPLVRCVSSSSLDYGSIVVAIWLSLSHVLHCIKIL